MKQKRKRRRYFQQEVLCPACGVAMVKRLKESKGCLGHYKVWLHRARIAKPTPYIMFCGCLESLKVGDDCVVMCINGPLRRWWLDPLGVRTISILTRPEQYANKACAKLKRTKLNNK